MQIPPPLHRWNLSPRDAVALQRRLAARIELPALGAEPRIVVGVDAAFSRDQRHCLAAAVAWDVEGATVVERSHARRPLTFPYVPGLLSFREAPALLAALRKLTCDADVVMCDGHGRAHPRRFGIACHLGLLVGRPALGVAKSRLAGAHREPARRRGSAVALRDRGERIGTVLRTRDGVRPLYVSPGHLIDEAGAVRLVLRCGRGYRLPEPTRLADRYVAEVKRDQSSRLS